MMYRTKSGDTWDSIAFELYGNEQYAQSLIEANKAYIDTVIFSANILLNAPEITKTASSSLPPWKQVMTT